MLLKISKLFLYVSLFCVVIVMTSTFFPFIGGKDYFFRFSVELALIFFLLWWAFEARAGEVYGRIRETIKHPLFIAVSIFVLVALLASFFAYDPHAAFWSNYERGEGAFQMLHYYVFFTLLVLLFDGEEEWRRLFKVSLAAAVLMVLYGIFANLGWADNFIGPYGGNPPDGWWARLTATRFQGSLGNPAYVAPYLLFSIFYTVYLWSSRKQKKDFVSGLFYGFTSLFFLFFFILSQTRGALLGLGAAIFSFLVAVIIISAEWRRRLFVVLVLFLLAGGLLIYNRNSNFVKSLPGGRIFDISFSENTVSTRFWTWGSAWQGFKERPILGWGQENFSPLFDKYFDPRHYVPGQNTETWFDRAHNIFLDYLTETGILGLLSYLGIFAVIYVEFFRKYIVKDKRFSAAEKALVVSMPIGYLVQGAAIFDVLPMYINLFMFFAFAYYWLYKAHESR
jgi:O-antigen ligase